MKLIFTLVLIACAAFQVAAQTGLDEAGNVKSSGGFVTDTMYFDQGNATYYSTGLYSADGSVLVRMGEYVSRSGDFFVKDGCKAIANGAFDMQTSGPILRVNIPSSVTTIAPFAFGKMVISVHSYQSTARGIATKRCDVNDDGTVNTQDVDMVVDASLKE